MKRKPTSQGTRTPKLCKHPDGRAYVRLKGRFHYLGRYGTPEAQQRYHALMAELAATGLPVSLENQPKDITVSEALNLYLDFAEGYYANAGRPGSHTGRIRAVVLCAVDLYGTDVASEFGPLKLKAVQAALVERNHCRSNINAMCGCLKLAFKWLASNELVPAQVALALTVVGGLRAGKTHAKESEPVRPVLEAHIEAVRAVLPPTVRAMVDLQLACGARSGEIVGLRPCDVDRSGAVWTVTLNRHKTAHRGKSRVLYLGPKAQAVLRPFLLNRGPSDYLFSPKEAIQQRARVAPTHRRKTQHKAPSKTDRTIATCYSVASYRRAIAHAVTGLNRKAKKEGRPEIPTWHPHQLRHNTATAVRKACGLEAAQLILGHTSADVTQIYAEADRQKAMEIAEKLG